MWIHLHVDEVRVFPSSHRTV